MRDNGGERGKRDDFDGQTYAIGTEFYHAQPTKAAGTEDRMGLPGYG
jgi:hypothetical protein